MRLCTVLVATKMTLSMLISSDFPLVRLSASEIPVRMAARLPIFIANH
jgi:hypothetical protein